MATVFELWHEYVTSAGEDEAKQIGVYSSRSSALEAILRLKLLPGFRDHPDGFNIYESELDRDGWTEGFITVRPSNS